MTITAADRERILSIATAMVADRVVKGEVNPDDEAALRKATKAAVADARLAYFAALEFVSG